MAQVKIRINGISYGRIVGVTVSVNCPEYQIITGRRFMDHALADLSVQDQQNQYIDDNYEEIVVKEAEKADIWPIFGFKMITYGSAKERREKKLNKIIETANEVFKGMDEDKKNNFIATLANMWDEVHMLSVERIFRITFAAMNVGIAVGMEIINRLNAIIDEKPPRKEKERIG